METNFCKMLEKHSIETPHKTAFTMLNSKGDVVESVTYLDLKNRATTIASHLSFSQNSSGTIVLLPQSIEFVEVFFGIAISGDFVIPAFSLESNLKNKSRLQGILNNSGAKRIITNHEGVDFLGFIENVEIIDISKIDKNQIVKSPIKYENKFFLQYTSGSTSEPKGVIISHKNVMECCAVLTKFYEQNRDSTIVMWVPLYHDLGLIGNMLFNVFLGSHCVMMSPETFIRTPFLWLKAVHDYKATLTFCPTFGYEYVLRDIKKIKDYNLDLSSITSFVIGAEPITKHAIDKFHHLLSSNGVKLTQFRTAYGLAESTLMIVSNSYGVAPHFVEVNSVALENGELLLEDANSDVKTTSLVSSGKAYINHVVKILSLDNDELCDEGKVGEILLFGPCITEGYHNSENQNLFFNLDAEVESGRYLKTGDLGAIMNGELFVTGRIKDLIIINGRNIYPQDLEFTSYQSSTFVRRGCAAAFEHNGAIYITCEVQDIDDKAECAKTKSLVSKEIFLNNGVLIKDVVFISKGKVSKTSSGKIQRQLMKKRFLSKEFN